MLVNFNQNKEKNHSEFILSTADLFGGGKLGFVNEMKTAAQSLKEA